MKLRNRSANSKFTLRFRIGVCKNFMIIRQYSIFIHYLDSLICKFEQEQNLTDVLALIGDYMTEKITFLSHSEL